MLVSAPASGMGVAHGCWPSARVKRPSLALARALTPLAHHTRLSLFASKQSPSASLLCLCVEKISKSLRLHSRFRRKCAFFPPVLAWRASAAATLPPPPPPPSSPPQCRQKTFRGDKTNGQCQYCTRSNWPLDVLEHTSSIATSEQSLYSHNSGSRTAGCLLLEASVLFPLLVRHISATTHLHA